jgi:hypothetical protein
VAVNFGVHEIVIYNGKRYFDARGTPSITVGGLWGASLGGGGGWRLVGNTVMDLGNLESGMTGSRESPPGCCWSSMHRGAGCVTTRC